MFTTWKLKRQIEALKKENIALRSQLMQKNQTIQYLNGCVNKANKRLLNVISQNELLKTGMDISFPNSEEVPEQISINDILEH